MNPEILSCHNLKKQFGENQVLRGIDLQINKGESLAIIGASGSGKSTLLRCLNFLEIPSSGEVRLRGELIGSQHNGQAQYEDASDLSDPGEAMEDNRTEEEIDELAAIFDKKGPG